MHARLFRKTGLVLAVLALLAGCGKDEETKEPEKAHADQGVTLSTEEIRSLGITTVAAQAADHRSTISGYGVVVPLDTIAQADADFLTAQAAAAQSRSAATRTRFLFTHEGAASRDSMETTQSKAAADQAALALARRKAEATFGHGAPWETGARGAIMRRLASGGTVLVRATFPMGTFEGQKPASLAITRLGTNARSWTATTIWEAPADPAFPGHGFYALVEGSDLAQNEHVSVSVPTGAPEAGVTIPAASVVFGENEAWVYTAREKGNFVRTPVPITNPVADGYFIPARTGIKAGQALVVNGAGLLLAREQNPSTEVEE
jgi:hypothetical protein